MNKQEFINRYNRIMSNDGMVEIHYNNEDYLVVSPDRYDYNGYEVEFRIELQEECFDIYEGNSHIIEISYSELEEEDVY